MDSDTQNPWHRLGNNKFIQDNENRCVSVADHHEEHVPAIDEHEYEEADENDEDNVKDEEDDK